MIDPPNVPRNIFTVIQAEKASYAELDSVLGVRDLYDLIEIILISAHNQNAMEKAIKQEDRF
jgi:hypothetical protein